MRGGGGSGRGSAGEESDEEWVEEQIEREESTESLEELGMAAASSSSSTTAATNSSSSSSTHQHRLPRDACCDPADLIVLDFGPLLKGVCMCVCVLQRRCRCCLLTCEPSQFDRGRGWGEEEGAVCPSALCSISTDLQTRWSGQSSTFLG